MKITFEQWLSGFFWDYQVWATFIAAFLGFAGVILTLIAQHRSDRALDIERTRRERLRVVAAFRTELLSMMAYARVARKTLVEWGQTDFMFPTQSIFPLFGAIGSKLDLLEPKEISAVVGCYVWLNEIPTRLALLSGSAPSNYVPVKAEHLHIALSLVTQLEALAEAAVETLAPQSVSVEPV